MTKGKILSIVGIVILVSVISGVGKYLAKNSTNDASAAWRTVDSPSGSFTALFPENHAAGFSKDPQLLNNQKTTMPGINAEVSLLDYGSVDLDGASYFLTAVTFPNTVDTSNDDNFLKMGLDKLGSKDHEISSTPTMFGQYKGLNYSFSDTLDGGVLFSKGRIIKAGKSMYLLMVTYGEDKFNQDNYNKFMTSFIIKK